jgi:hypothetical protein
MNHATGSPAGAVTATSTCTTTDASRRSTRRDRAGATSGGHPDDSMLASSTSVMLAADGAHCASGLNVVPTLVDLLIDSQLDWRQIIGRANEGQHLSDHLSEAQIKRQEIIHELIQTERHHCLTLALMRQIYLAGLLKLNALRQRNSQPSGALAGQHEPSGGLDGPPSCQQPQQAGGEPIDIERLFPALEELIQAHELFFAHLRLRLVDCCSLGAVGQSSAGPAGALKRRPPLVGIIGPLGDLLIEQFRLTSQPQQQQHGCPPAGGFASKSRAAKLRHRHHHREHSIGQSAATNSMTAGSTNTNGYKLLQAYAKFCGQHYESSRYFKQLMLHDKGFKQFIEVSSEFLHREQIDSTCCRRRRCCSPPARHHRYGGARARLAQGH